MSAETKTKTTESPSARLEAFGRDALDAGRQVWLAGLGATAEMSEGSKRLFDRLVEKGEGFEKKAKKDLDAGLDRAGARLEKVRNWARTNTRKGVDGASEGFSGVLERLGLPSHEDIRGLTHRVEALTEKVEALAAK